MAPAELRRLDRAGTCEHNLEKCDFVRADFPCVSVHRSAGHRQNQYSQSIGEGAEL